MLEYNPDNVFFLLERVESAHKAKKLPYDTLADHIKEETGSGEGLAYSTWYDLIRDKHKYKAGTKIFREDAFYVLTEFLSEKGLLTNDAYSSHVTSVSDFMHYAVSDFLKLPVDDPDSQKDLAGYYFTYRPRRTRSNEYSGAIVKGLARFSYNPTGAIVAKEITRYKPDPKTKTRKQNVKGYVYRKGENLFWLGLESDTEYVRTILLRRKLNQTKLQNLYGAFFAFDGPFLFSAPICFDRVDISNYKDLMQHVRELGYYDKKEISQEMRELLTSHEINKTTFFNF